MIVHLNWVFDHINKDPDGKWYGFHKRPIINNIGYWEPQLGDKKVRLHTMYCPNEEVNQIIRYDAISNPHYVLARTEPDKFNFVSILYI